MLSTPNITSQLGDHQIQGLHHPRPSSKGKEQEVAGKFSREDSVEVSHEGISRLRQRKSNEIAAQNLLAAGSSFGGYEEALSLITGFDQKYAEI